MLLLFIIPTQMLPALGNLKLTHTPSIPSQNHLSPAHLPSTTVFRQAGQVIFKTQHKPPRGAHLKSHQELLHSSASLPFGCAWSLWTSGQRGSQFFRTKVLLLTFHKVTVRPKHIGFISLPLQECFWCLSGVYGTIWTQDKMSGKQFYFPSHLFKSGLQSPIS